MKTRETSMNHLRNTLVVPKYVLVRGILSGCFVAFSAIQIFVCIYLWWSHLLPLANVEWREVQFLLFALLFVNIVSILPVLLNSYILTLILYQKAKFKKLSFIETIFVGAFLGAITGFIICIISFFVVRGRVDLQLLITRTFFVTSIAAILAGLTAKSIAAFIEKSKGNKNEGAIK